MDVRADPPGVEGSDGGTICNPDDRRIKELGRIEVKFRRCFSDRQGYWRGTTALGQVTKVSLMSIR